MADLRFFHFVLAQILSDLSHCIFSDNRNTAFGLKQIRRSYTVSKIPLSSIKQQTVLRALLLKYFLKLLISQQLFFFEFKLVRSWKMSFHTLYKLFCHISCGIHQHDIHRL